MVLLYFMDYFCMSYKHEKVRLCAQEFFDKLAKISTRQQLEDFRTIFLSRNGAIASLMGLLKTFSIDEKRLFGPEFNAFRTEANNAFTAKLAALEEAEKATHQKQFEHFDVTAYLSNHVQGSLHPVTKTVECLENILITMGFELLDGPEIESEEINFNALNIPPHHPARDMQDTFWLKLPGLLPRTHTSPVQIHGMRSRQAPLSIASIGRAYRNEATDASHDFIFMQCEGMVIDKKISLAHLLGTARALFQAVYPKEKLDIRIRPSYFPFVEPGLELDITCPFCTNGCSTCKQSRWIEMGGAGLIHPHVLRAGNINPEEYSGFAFGFGLSRMVMLKYAINDVRLLHSYKTDFLKQF